MLKQFNDYMKMQKFSDITYFHKWKRKITKSDAKKSFYSMMTNFNPKNECKSLTKITATYKNNENNAWNQIQNHKNE